MSPPPEESDSPATPPPPRSGALPGTDWPGQLGGRFVVFDGPDGSGKSTQFRRIVRLAESAGVTVCEVREPGGTHIGEEIRKVLLDAQHEEEAPIDLRCEMLLFMASRAQLIAQRVRPALARGELVLADRFISSTLAYQGAGGGLPVEEIIAAGKVALQECWPDLVVVFDVDSATARARMNPLLRGQEFEADQDRMESKGDAFHRKVRQGYLDQAAGDPGHYLVVDARGEEDGVYDALCRGLAERVAGFDPK